MANMIELFSLTSMMLIVWYCTFKKTRIFKKKVLTRVVIFLLIAGFTTSIAMSATGMLEKTALASEVKDISVVVDGTKIEFDQPPENINGRVMVPVKYVVEKIGCKVEWEGETQTVYINTAGVLLEKNAVKTENINVYVDNVAVVFGDQQPVNKNGRTLIPISFVVERLGYKAEWNGELQTVFIQPAVEEGNVEEPTKVVLAPTETPGAETANSGSSKSQDVDVKTEGVYIGSLESDKYHYLDCRFAKNILSQNEIWFDSVSEAQQHGYQPCSSCKPPSW